MNILRTPPRGGSRPRLAIEPLEPRCACSAGFLTPDGPFLDPPREAAAPPPPVAAIRGEWSYDSVGPPPVAVVKMAGASAQPDETTAVGPKLQLRVGEKYQGVVAHFTDMDPANVVASIDWGNGSITGGQIMAGPSGAGFDVIGSGQFDQPGVFNMTVRLTPAGGEPILVGGTAEVTPPETTPSDLDTDLYGPKDGDPPPPQTTPTPGPVTTTTPTNSYTSGDSGGGVPWVRPTDPPPADDKTAAPGVDLPTVTAEPESDAAKSNGPPAEAPVGPAYLAQAAREPAAAVPVAPVVVLPLAVIDLRAAGGGTIEPIDVLTPAGAPPQADAAGLPHKVAVADAPPVVAPAAESQPAKAKAERRPGAWRSGVAWCLALVFAERTVAAWRGERVVVAARNAKPRITAETETPVS